MFRISVLWPNDFMWMCDSYVLSCNVNWKFIKKWEIVSFKRGSWKISEHIRSLKLYLGAVIWDHQVKLNSCFMCVCYNIACDHVVSVSARRICLRVLPMQSLIWLISSASNSNNWFQNWLLTYLVCFRYFFSRGIYLAVVVIIHWSCFIN